MILEKYTIGVGDRFAHQAAAQLQACVKLAEQGINVIPVWNKSNREHSFIGSEPQSVYDAAEAAVAALGWDKGWHVDADHINMDTSTSILSAPISSPSTWRISLAKHPKATRWRGLWRNIPS